MTDRHEEQAALYALDSLDPHDRRILQSEMRVDARLRETVADFEDASAQLALLLAPEAPPQELRGWLLMEIRRRRRSNVVSSFVFWVIRSPLIAWMAAMAMGAACFTVWTRSEQLARQVADLAASEQAARSTVAEVSAVKAGLDRQLAGTTARADSLAAEVTRLNSINAVARMEVTTLRSSLKRFEDSVAVVVWDAEKQQGRIKLEKIPSVPPNKDYQLWVIAKGNPVPVDGGVVKVNARGAATVDFVPREPVANVSKFTLSVEKEGGVPKGEGPVVMAGP